MGQRQAVSFDSVWAMWQDTDDSGPAIGFGGREKVAWNATKMAQYFEKKLFEAKWHRGFVSVNIGALSTQFIKWRNRGKTEEEVQSLIDLYMTVESSRGSNPGWRDFLSRADRIAATVTSEAPQGGSEDREALLDQAWKTGTLEAFQRAFPDNAEKAQRYYDMHKES